MPAARTDARATVEVAARGLLAALAADPPAHPVRVADAAGGLFVVIQAGPASARLALAAAESRPRAVRNSEARRGCRADVLAVIREAGRPLTRKEVMRALRDAGFRHGPGTVAKALADLTGAGELVNPRDGLGYRLPAWVPARPTLFPR